MTFTGTYNGSNKMWTALDRAYTSAAMWFRQKAYTSVLFYFYLFIALPYGCGTAPHCVGFLNFYFIPVN